MSFLLDTNVISELRRGTKCNRGVRSWHAGHPSEDFFLSVITLGEIRKGIELSRQKDSAKAASFERWLESLEVAFDGRILSVTTEITDLWGKLLAPSNISPIDGLIAATAGYHGHTVATRNERDFQSCGVDYINPFEV